MPKPSITAVAIRPSTGAANSVVPKKAFEMAFCMAGVPGSAAIVKVNVPSEMGAGIRRCGTRACLNSAEATG